MDEKPAGSNSVAGQAESNAQNGEQMPATLYSADGTELADSTNPDTDAPCEIATSLLCPPEGKGDFAAAESMITHKPANETANGEEAIKSILVTQKPATETANGEEAKKSILVGGSSSMGSTPHPRISGSSQTPVSKSDTQVTCKSRKSVRMSVLGVDGNDVVAEPGQDDEGPLIRPQSFESAGDEDFSAMSFDEASSLMKAIRSRKDEKRSKHREYKPMSKVVSIAFKVWLIRDIYPIESTFKCQFRVFLEWLDEAAVGLPGGVKVDKDQEALLNIPEITIQNVLDFKIEDKSAAPEVINSQTGHVAYQVLYSATVQMEYNMSLFPFDSQMLKIVLHMGSSKDSDRAFYFQYCEVEEQKGLEEWQVHSNYGESEVVQHTPQVTVGVLIQRRSRYYVVNALLLLFMLSSMTFCLYAIRLDDFGNRAMIFMAISLTQVTFKLSVENKLPKISYSTSFDLYAMSCQAMLLLTAIGHAVVAQLAKDDKSLATVVDRAVGLSFAGLWVLWNAGFSLFSWRVKNIKKRPSHSLPHTIEARDEKNRSSRFHLPSSEISRPGMPSKKLSREKHPIAAGLL